ncbi:MAG: N-acetyl-gamma-glutamyl-phosphate reductase [Solirubrobacteraceae bacterium]|nr:N-acetyl-gamma-glutamyl-phosphate reductase [Solirubrobacteraceae bacterium]
MASGSTRVGIVGASGYAGAIAAQLIERHPFFELAYVTARAEAGMALGDLHPRTRVERTLEAFDPDREVDAAIVGYPHGAAAPTVAALRERGVRVIDLSADFRLTDRATYAQWYGEHGAPELFGTAVYGLPELYRDALRTADLVAGPGCYPTAALLGLVPLARAGLIGDAVIIDAKSGVSGAGRGATDMTHFVSANEDLKPYKVAGHRHRPEIEQELAAAGADRRVVFVPHLAPLSSGELDSCYVAAARETSTAELHELFAGAYGGEPFVTVLDGRQPGVLEVRETNDCRIAVHYDERAGQILVFAAIDNLWKGTASQAVQSLNLMFDRPETEGLK